MRFRLSPGVCLAYVLSLILGSAFFSGLTASPFEPYTRDGREFSEFLEKCADQISLNRVPLCRVDRVWLTSNRDPNGWYGSAKIISQNTQPDTTEKKASKAHPNRFVGYTMLGSGLFLSSWGIVSWEMKEYQECPPSNTDNVIKIVAGILLINAALFYLFGGCDQGSF